MHAAARLADEWSLEVNADEFSRELAVLLRLFQLLVAANVARNAFEAVAGLLDCRGDGGGDERRGAVARDRGGNAVECAGGAFHHVVAAGAVDVYVYKSGHDGHFRGDVVHRI